MFGSASSIPMEILDEKGVDYEDLFKSTKPRLTYRLYLSSFSAFGGLLLVGMGLGFSSSALPNLESVENMNPMTSNQGALFASLLNVGAMLAVPISEYVCRKYGRRNAMLLSVLLFLIGNGVLAHVQDISKILFGRVIVGCGVGAMTIAAPLYLSEIVHRQFRPKFEAYAQTSLMSGIFIAYTFGYAPHWRWMCFISSCFGVIALVVITLSTESPVWLVAKEKKSDAINVLVQLRGRGTDVRDECDEMEASIIYQQFKSVKGWKQLIQWRRTKPAFVIMGIIFFNQLSGAHAIIFYAQFILKHTQSMFDPRRGAIFLGVVFALCAFLTGISRTIIRWKTLIIFSQLGLTLFNVIFAVFCYLCAEEGPKYCESHSWVPVIGLLVFAVSYSLNPVLTDLMVATDIVVSEIRRFCHCILMMWLYFISFCVTVLFYQTNANIMEPYGPFFAFFAISIIGFFYCWIMVPNIKTFDTEEVEVYTRAPSAANDTHYNFRNLD